MKTRVTASPYGTSLTAASFEKTYRDLLREMERQMLYGNGVGTVPMKEGLVHKTKEHNRAAFERFLKVGRSKKR